MLKGDHDENNQKKTAKVEEQGEWVVYKSQEMNVL